MSLSKSTLDLSTASNNYIFGVKAKLITSQMFAAAWEAELNKFISDKAIRVVDIKFSVAALDEPMGSDMALYSALVLYEEK